MPVVASLGTRRAQSLLAEALINAPGESVSPVVTQLLNEHIRQHGQFLTQSVLREVNSALASARGTAPAQSTEGTRAGDNPLEDDAEAAESAESEATEAELEEN